MNISSNSCFSLTNTPGNGKGRLTREREPSTVREGSCGWALVWFPLTFNLSFPRALFLMFPVLPLLPLPIDEVERFLSGQVLADGRNLQRNQLRNPSVSSLYSRVWTDLGSPAIFLSSSRFPFLSDPHLKDKKGSSESRKWWRNGWKKMKAKEDEQYARAQQWVIVCQIHRRIPQSRVAYLFFLRILLLRL